MEQPEVDHIVEISSPSPDAIFQQPEIEIMPRQEVLTASTFNLENSPTIGNGNGNGSLPIGSSVNYRHLRLQLVIIGVQVFAAVLVLLLSLSMHEPKTPLRDSIIMYSIGCIAALPLLFWGVDRTRGQATDLYNFCIQRSIQFETFLYFFMEDNVQRTDENLSLKQMLMMCLRIMLNLGFGFWLVTAGIKILKEISSPSGAPILYSLNIVYFSYSFLVHVLGLIVFPVLTCARALEKQGSSEMIDSLPTHIFTAGGNDGGVVAQGTDNERVISENEAVCAICLATYDDNDELRELPCSHLLHKDCVDRWLRIKARCPLCNRVIRRVPS